MKKYKVTITDLAEQDLRDIFDYIAWGLFAPFTAARQLDRLEEAIGTLDTFPESHRVFEMESMDIPNLRILPVDNYCIFFVPDKEKMTVTVIRILYEGRDSEAQLDHYS